MSIYRSLGLGYGPLGLQVAKKPRIFVSYHHGNDQQWYDKFVAVFGQTYDLFMDSSLERKVDSDDCDYTRRRIREENIAGSSMTIVLCGPETWKRRWVDWEIQTTLNKEHALLGIVLPNSMPDPAGRYIVPDRLLENINSGYAYWIPWPQSIQELAAAIAEAQNRRRFTSRIVNVREAMRRSLS